jgi:hypothetical protein
MPNEPQDIKGQQGPPEILPKGIEMPEALDFFRKECASPKCKERLKNIGRENARFLFAYAWTERGIIIEAVCPYCKTQHIVELVRPQ